MYYLKIISLEGCPFSEAVNSFVKDKKINSKITTVTQNEKNKFKTDEITTFPQIFLNKEHSSGNVLIGGYSTIKSYYDQIQSNKKSLNDVVKKIKKENDKLSEKSILRLVQLLL